MTSPVESIRDDAGAVNIDVLTTSGGEELELELEQEEEEEVDEVESDEEQSVGWIMARKLESMMKNILEIYLRNVRYEADRCSKLTKDVCEVIKDQAKELLFEHDKYRLVVQVVLGQEEDDQTVQLASRCLCDQRIDSCATATYRSRSLYAMSVVCAFNTA